MQKPLLSTEIVEPYQGRPSDSPKSPDNIADNTETFRQRRTLRSRFNPSVVGFGILETTKHAALNATRTNEAIDTSDRRRSDNLEEGK